MLLAAVPVRHGFGPPTLRAQQLRLRPGSLAARGQRRRHGGGNDALLPEDGGALAPNSSGLALAQRFNSLIKENYDLRCKVCPCNGFSSGSDICLGAVFDQYPEAKKQVLCEIAAGERYGICLTWVVDCGAADQCEVVHQAEEKQCPDVLQRSPSRVRSASGLPGIAGLQRHADEEYPSQVALTEEDADLVIKWLAIRDRTLPKGVGLAEFLAGKGDDRVAAYWQGMMRAGFAVQIIDADEVRWRFTKKGLHLRGLLRERGFLGEAPPETPPERA